MVRRLLALAAVLLVLSGCAAEPAVSMSNGTDATLAPFVSQPAEETVTDPVTFPSTQPPTQVTLPEVEPQEDDFVRVLDYIPEAKQYLPYATVDNFTGAVIYSFTDAYLRYGTVKKLMAVSSELRQYGFGLLIWDGYRPVYAQQALYDAFPDSNYVSPPGVGNQNHCRGRAVDLTLIDLTSGKEVEMPTGFDEFSSLADRDYSDVSPRAAFNALLLEQTMERHGFQGYSGEWWHFNDTDEYPIETVFDPAI